MSKFGPGQAWAQLQSILNAVRKLVWFIAVLNHSLEHLTHTVL